MKRFICLQLIALLAVMIPGCMKQPSAIDSLNTSDDVVDSMRIKGEKPASQSVFNNPKMDEVIEAPEEKVTPSEDIDLAALEELKKPRLQKFVITTGNNVPLRGGPGTKYQKTIMAQKNQEFKLLREIRKSENSPIWYLVLDENNEKHFIPKLFARVEERMIGGTPPETDSPAKEDTSGGEEPVSGITVKRPKRLDPENVRHVVDPSPPIPEELVKAKHITLNFEGTDIYDVITTFAELLKLDYVIEGNVVGKVTLQTFNQIPATDLYAVFEQILAVTNVTVVKSGNFYRFMPLPDAPRKPLSIYYGNDQAVPNKDRVVIQIIPLKYVANNAMKQVITPLLSANATLLDVPDTRNLMLIDLSSNVHKVMKVIRAIDIDKLAASDIRLFEMTHSDATVVTEELTEIFTSMGYQKALGESLTFLPITRLNSLLVVNSLEDVMKTVEFWVDKLDQPMTGGNLSTFVYYVQNAEADKLSTILNSIFADSNKEDPKQNKTVKAAQKQQQAKTKPAGATNPRTGAPEAKPFRIQGGISAQVEGDLLIIPDTDTNSLVIRTAAKNYPGVLELVKKLDLLPQQVVIEVMILDLTLDDQTRTGLEWAAQRTDADEGYIYGGGSTGNSPPSTGSSLASSLTLAATPLFAPGANFFVGNPAKLIAVLQAFASDSKANIVANPVLVTSDNKEATISITDDIPIQSSTLTTNTQTPVTNTTVEFRSVGVKLGILPKINSDNFVNLKINQEISNPGPEVQGTPSFQTRVVNTEVVLKDNQILVMGGLMRTNTTESITGVPILKDIPGLGRLFSTVEETTNKTELMLFITPHIISNTDDGKFVTDHFRQKLGNLQHEPTLLRKAEQAMPFSRK